MQPMSLYILLCKRFVDAFENPQLRKTKQILPVWLCMTWYIQSEETYEFPQWRQVKNAVSVTMHPLKLAIWGDIWKRTVEKNLRNAISVNLHPLRQDIWGCISKRTVVKRQTIATNVTMNFLKQLFWRHIWKYTSSHLIIQKRTNIQSKRRIQSTKSESIQMMSIDWHTLVPQYSTLCKVCNKCFISAKKTKLFFSGVHWLFQPCCI